MVYYSEYNTNEIILYNFRRYLDRQTPWNYTKIDTYKVLKFLKTLNNNEKKDNSFTEDQIIELPKGVSFKNNILCYHRYHSCKLILYICNAWLPPVNQLDFLSHLH